MSLHRERGAMVVDDIAALPVSPLIVAEGSVITPASVPTGQPAVWLLPPPSRQRRRLVTRDGSDNSLYRLVADEIEAELAATCAPRIAIEGVAETIVTVEEMFSEQLAVGPHARSIGERRELLREANLAHVDQVRAFHRRPWTTGDSETVERTFVCECGERSCDADVRAMVGRAADGPVVALGHRRLTSP
jgi:hypothetical protein